jgi:hypothetical protein
MLNLSALAPTVSVLALAALLFTACGGPEVYEKSIEVSSYNFTMYPERGADVIEPEPEPEPEPPPEDNLSDPQPGGDATAAVRAEALKPSRGDEGRPLPLAAHWHGQNFALADQLDMIEEGRHILPVIQWPKPTQSTGMPDGFQRLKEKNLPFSIIFGLQWTYAFGKSRILDDFDHSDDVLNDDGKLNPDVDPQEWYDLGVAWTTQSGIKALQEAYPDPPLVHLYSNNERRELSGESYRDQEEALFEGLRDGLEKQAWKENSMILGYQGIAPPWEGGSHPYYQRDWKPWRKMYTFRSVQTSVMNVVPSKRRLIDSNPDLWWELIYWIGNEEKRQQYRDDGYKPPGPTRYRGWVQFGLWLTTPRVARQWNESTRQRLGDDGFWDNFREVIRAVDAVHNNDTLTRFWRKGELVPNTDYENRFAPSWMGESTLRGNRYFLLDTSEHPAFGSPAWWDEEVEIPVFALARELDGEYLIYAHAPLGDRDDVEIEIPGYGTVTARRVEEGGSFYHVDSSGSVKNIR